jgi:hypothetical protein
MMRIGELVDRGERMHGLMGIGRDSDFDLRSCLGYVEMRKVDARENLSLSISLMFSMRKIGLRAWGSLPYATALKGAGSILAHEK